VKPDLQTGVPVARRLFARSGRRLGVIESVFAAGRDNEVKRGEQEVLHARVSVGQTPGAMQRLSDPGISARIGNSKRIGERTIVVGKNPVPSENPAR
jgi:hypothetical protein